MILKIHGDTEATEQLLCRYVTDKVFGKVPFLKGAQCERPNGYVFTANCSSQKFPQAVVERLSELGYSEDDVTAHCWEPEGAEEGEFGNGIMRISVNSNPDKCLWLENVHNMEHPRTFTNNTGMLVDNVDNLRKLIEKRQLGFVAFEIPRSSYSTIKDGGEFYELCEEISRETGALIIVRYIWDEYNKNLYERITSATADEIGEFSSDTRYYMALHNRLSGLKPYISAIHNTENNMIHVLAADTDGSRKEMDVPYLPVLIQRLEGEPLAGSMELDY